MELLRKYIKKPYIVVCSKRKKGTKGCKQSGKTYYCPESQQYLNIIALEECSS